MTDTMITPPHLIIIRGAPGSGKSTLASALLADREMYTAPTSSSMFYEKAVCPDKPLVCWAEADMFMVDEQGQYKFDASKHKENHQKCLDAVTTALQHGHDAIVSNTFIKRWEYQPYLEAANLANATHQVVDLYGTFQSVHGVPAETVARMRTQFEPHATEPECAS